MKKRELYVEQQLHASILKSALDTYGAALDASGTGCGKTLIGAELAATYRQPTLVIAPKSSLPMWQDEMKVRGWPAIGVINYELLRNGNTPWGAFVKGSRNKVWQWTVPKNTMFIWDEVHKSQGINSQNAAMLWSSKDFQNLMLSATAAEDPTQMKALGYILGCHTLKGFYSWCLMNGCKKGYWGGLEFSGGDEAIEKLHKRIFPKHGHRLTQDDLREHFQDTTIITTPLEFGEEIHKVYEEMEAELAVIKGKERHDASEAIRIRARQRAEMIKVPYMLEKVDDLLREKKSVAVFVNYDATLEALKERLSPLHKLGFINGRYVKDRQRYIDEFQADKIRVILCNVQAGGVSVNLHDTHGRYPRASIISPSDNAKDILQVVGRIHRAEGQSTTQQFILFAAGTVEEEVEANCRDKMGRIKIFNEGLKKTVDAAPLIWDDKTTLKAEKNEETRPVETYPQASAGINGGALTDEDTRDHATYPPSSIGNFKKCAGFRNRSGKDSETPASRKGTLIHKALEKDAIEELEEEDDQKCAQILKDYIDGEVLERFQTTGKMPSINRKEVRMKMALHAGLSTFGTCDRLLIYDATGLMYDYKTGVREVADPEENAQAWCYVVGAFQKYEQLDEIIFKFLVPNRDEILEHIFKRSDLPTLILKINTIIRQAMEIDWSQPVDPTKLNPQPELCEYCMHQAHCPSLAAKVLTLSAKVLPGLPVPESALVSADRPQDIPHLLRLAPIMEAWAAGVKSAALKLNMEDGLEIDGYRRIERKLPRSARSVIGAYECVKDKIELDDFLEACGTVSIVKLEDMFAAQVKKGKGKARQELNNRLRQHDVLREEGTTFYLKERKA